MQRSIKIFIIFLVFTISAFAAWDSLYQKGKIKKGNIPVWGDKNGQVEDSGISAASLTNAAAVAEILSTNDAANIEFKENKNVANGYAGLDAEGNLNAELVETIIVTFAGAEAVDVP